ncbi:hypothetical protein BX666DRAFT_1948853, partial [Dichotomocladium elegans]
MLHSYFSLAACSVYSVSNHTSNAMYPPTFNGSHGLKRRSLVCAVKGCYYQIVASKTSHSCSQTFLS